MSMTLEEIYSEIVDAYLVILLSRATNYKADLDDVERRILKVRREVIFNSSYNGFTHALNDIDVIVKAINGKHLHFFNSPLIEAVSVGFADPNLSKKYKMRRNPGHSQPTKYFYDDVTFALWNFFIDTKVHMIYPDRKKHEDLADHLDWFSTASGNLDDDEVQEIMQDFYNVMSDILGSVWRLKKKRDNGEPHPLNFADEDSWEEAKKAHRKMLKRFQQQIFDGLDELQQMIADISAVGSQSALYNWKKP